MSDKELMKQARKIATDDLLIKHVVYVLLSDKRLEKIIKLVRQHSPTKERVIEVVKACKDIEGEEHGFITSAQQNDYLDMAIAAIEGMDWE